MAAAMLSVVAAACSSGAAGGPGTEEFGMDLQAVANRVIDAVESGDIDEVVAVYAPNGRQIHPFAEEPIEGREAIGLSDGALLAAFPDVTIVRRGVIPGGSTVAIELVLVATHTGPLDLGDGQVLPPTGRRIEVPSVWVLDIDDDGLIAEERAYFDSALFFRQLGLQE
jgi:ketosteroid isomerase-like protein